MLTGYLFILSAAVCWGLSATWARWLIMTGVADAVLISQTRVLFAWLILAICLLTFSRKHFRVAPKDLPMFAVLGVIGMAGANYFLYWAIGQMNAALADLIQYTAPIIVVLWMWIRKFEPLDSAKAIALALSVTGCALALGITSLQIAAPPIAIMSALASAVCFATTLILGKKAAASHSVLTYLHYALLSATVFWFFITPPAALIHSLNHPTKILTLIVFSLTSILIPYYLLFAGLRRVPASRASIVSTFEPVVVALGSWIFLSESLSPVQFAGMAIVVFAIILVEVTSPRKPTQTDLL